MADNSTSDEHDLTPWRALRAWLDTDEEGQALLARLQADPDPVAEALAA